MKDGFLLINKPVGWTSRDVCNKIGHLFGVKKVGHCGTLDPFASGLLIVCLGKATKLVPYLENYDKKYEAVMKVGEKTNTGDYTGEIIATSDKRVISREEFENSSENFLGDIEQVPPMVSALKVNGQPLYELARKGIEIERKARKVHIFSLDLVNIDGSDVTFLAHVSKGTYIRTLAEDLASDMGTLVHLKKLHRTAIGNVDVSKAKTIEELEEKDIIGITEFVSSFMSIIQLDKEDSIKAIHGGKLSKRNVNPGMSGHVLVTDEEDNPLAIYEIADSYLKCVRGL